MILAMELHFLIFLSSLSSFKTLSYSAVQPRRIDIFNKKLKIIEFLKQFYGRQFFF